MLPELDGLVFDDSGNHRVRLRATGYELDLAVKLALDVHTTALLGHSYMWPGEFIDATGDSDNPSLFYVQIEYKF
jgi:hypothetical protein